MRSRVILAIALATVLRGVPSFTSAAESTVPDPSPWGSATIPLVVGAATATLAGTVLLVAARRRTSSGSAAGTAAPIDATEDEVTAALQRRTLRRGRVRIEDEPPAGADGLPPGARRMDESS